jgi:hypothetical protein
MSSSDKHVKLPEQLFQSPVNSSVLLIKGVHPANMCQLQVGK